MNEARNRFLTRVRQAVAEGNRVGGAPPLPNRGGVGYQGAGADPIAWLRTQLTAAGAHLYLAPDAAAATALVVELAREKAARSVLLGDGPVVESLALPAALAPVGVEVESLDSREAFFRADLGVTGVEYLIAETGTLVLATRPNQPRAASLLPPVHVAIVRREQLLADLFDLFDHYASVEEMPACLSLITGPSKTGDIELRLVTGVHGPGEVHVVLLAATERR